MWKLSDKALKHLNSLTSDELPKSKKTKVLVQFLEDCYSAVNDVVPFYYEIDGVEMLSSELDTKTKAQIWADCGMLEFDDPYEIVELEKKQTIVGNNYFNITAMDKETGELIRCKYFGNTTPTRLRKIEHRTLENSDYLIGIIQPHTSRDRKTGKFVRTNDSRKQIK